LGILAMIAKMPNPGFPFDPLTEAQRDVHLFHSYPPPKSKSQEKWIFIVAVMESAGAMWSPEQRRLGWVVMTVARRALKLTVSPCIASAYVLLHHYFKNAEARKARPLQILLAASLFLACKLEDCYRSLIAIVKELAIAIGKVEKYVPKEHMDRIFGDCKKEEFCLDEVKEVSTIELELLNAIQWEVPIELPFQHINEMKHEFGELAGTENVEMSFSSILRDLCLITQDVDYLSIPPVVSAAASVAHCIEEGRLPSKIKTWILELKENHPESFAKATTILNRGASLCVPIGLANQQW
jgi:hypothetical protein